MPDWSLLILTWGAGALLAGHGGLFVSFGLAAGSDADAYWHIRFRGPWFLLGGILFMVAGWICMRGSTQRASRSRQAWWEASADCWRRQLPSSSRLSPPGVTARA